MLEEWLQIAEKSDFVRPTYYQGQYNLICRSYEDGFPLAGGFLTGKLAPASSASDLKGTRFEVSDSNPLGKAARHWYDKPSMHEVNERLRALAQEQDIPMEALAMRWLLYHSALEEEDGVIFGASNPRQAGKTINTIKAGPLLKDMAAKSFRSCAPAHPRYLKIPVNLLNPSLSPQRPPLPLTSSLTTDNEFLPAGPRVPSFRVRMRLKINGAGVANTVTKKSLTAGGLDSDTEVEIVDAAELSSDIGDREAQKNLPDREIYKNIRDLNAVGLLKTIDVNVGALTNRQPAPSVTDDIEKSSSPYNGPERTRRYRRKAIEQPITRRKT
ncbi:MAG: hypothetical protein LQ340_003295 [Diploschistes diacapsis]|nr:MAG: hypothetical protein LQ340_003295 [Diploschistes diacapsis]